MKITTFIRKTWPMIKWGMRIQLVGVVFSCLCALCSGCATGYLADRGRDGADIFTATVGTGGGLRLRAGPFHVGIIANTDHAGLRAGTMFLNSNGRNMIVGDTLDFLVIPLNGFGRDGLVFRDTIAPERHKGFYSSCCVPLFSRYALESRVGNNSAFALVPQIVPHYTLLEIAGGLFGTVRLGFNPGELIDFVLGWVGIDIFKDDVGSIDKEKRSNPTSDGIRHPVDGLPKPSM